MFYFRKEKKILRNYNRNNTSTTEKLYVVTISNT